MMNNYAEQERAKWWPVSPELMAEYRDGSHTHKDWYGGLGWSQDNQYHRDGDRPAIIDANGRIEWRQNDLLHRIGDRPAVIHVDGALEWRQNSQTHRTRGPARIYPSGDLEWFINGENITQEVNAWLAGEEWQGTPEQIERFQRKFT